MKEKIIEYFYRVIKIPYEFLFKNNKEWHIKKEEFLLFPKNSIGYQLGQFLKTNNLEVQPNLEEHDVYHTLTNIGITVKNEIELQYFLLGNGKKSPFVFIVIITGFLFYPTDYKHFKTFYTKGKKAHQLYHLQFKNLLSISLAEFKSTYNIN
jgi:ubiquinone biosynthesis protein Coq4